MKFLNITFLLCLLNSSCSKSQEVNCDSLIQSEKDGIAFLKNSTNPFSGKCVSYYENGKIERETFYKDGLIDSLIISWYKSGAIMGKVHLKNNLPHGETVSYYENGNIQSKMYFTNGVQSNVFNEWYENGNKKTEIHYSNGMPDGITYQWYENGKIESDATFIKGIPNGPLNEYDKLGNLKKTTIFKNSQIVETIEY